MSDYTYNTIPSDPDNNVEITLKVCVMNNDSPSLNGTFKLKRTLPADSTWLVILEETLHLLRGAGYSYPVDVDIIMDAVESVTNVQS